MKDIVEQTVVKSKKTPKDSSERHTNKGGAKARVPARKEEVRLPSLAEVAKLIRAESAPVAISSVAREPAKTKKVAGTKVEPAGKGARRGAKSTKAEARKSNVNPVEPAAPKSEVGASSTTPKPPKPKGGEPILRQAPRSVETSVGDSRRSTERSPPVDEPPSAAGQGRRGACGDPRSVRRPDATMEPRRGPLRPPGIPEVTVPGRARQRPRRSRPRPIGYRPDSSRPTAGDRRHGARVPQ